jgi:hypothetical protein
MASQSNCTMRTAVDGEALRDRVKVGVVGRRVAQLGACSFGGVHHAPDLVRSEVGHDDDGAVSEFKSEPLLDPSHEALAVVILPPYFRTRTIRSLASARLEQNTVGQRDAAGTPWVISPSAPSVGRLR